MEHYFANLFYRFFNCIFKCPEYTKMRWWSFRNRDKIVQLQRLHTRVLNELKSYGISLPTKFKITLWGVKAYHDEATDTIVFPLSYLSPRFRFHGDSCIGYIRHEYGHACIEHYREQIGLSGFRDLFGDYDEPYENFLFICWKKRRFDWKHYITKYSQVHPAEDFAESFFVYLQKKGDVEYLKSHRPLVYEKMQYVKKVLTALGKIDFSSYN